MDDDVNFITMPSQRLINGVVHHLKHHMVQASAIMRVANIHTRALAYSLKTF